MKHLNLGERISKACIVARKSVEELKTALFKLPTKQQKHRSKYHF